ncbi:ABC transporter substrate-binding protein [Leucobacter luti]|uniref:ABC transporter substrate-binding protein n=1 Tax=Leucobacter luti TaxID=340320 RepID=UPI003D032366
MNRTRPATALAALASLALLAGCTGSPDPGAEQQSSTGDSAYPVTIDNCGEEVTLDAAPSSVFTVGTTALWNLHAAGAGDRVIARSGEFGADLNNDELTEFYADLPIIDPSDPTTEAIVATGTDFVVGYGLFNSSREALADAGIGSIENSDECAGGHSGGGGEGASVDAILADIERFGTVFDTRAQADATVAELRSQLDKLATQRPEKEATALIAYYFLGSFGSHGGTNVSTDILDRAGLVNVFADEPGLFIDPSLESVIDSDPDYIIVHYGVEGESFEQARDAFLAEPGVSDMRAVQKGNIIGVPYEGLMFTAGAIDGIRALIDARTEGGSR